MYIFSATPRISVLSTRFARIAVAATDQGVPVDPTASAIQFAFMQGGDQPDVGDWATGSWETAGDEYLARCLVGPDGAATLDVGSYAVWIKLVLAPETLVESVGDLTIY